MLKLKSKLIKCARCLLLLCVIAIGVMTIVASGGGGGDGSANTANDVVLNVSYVPNYGQTCASSSMTMMLQYFDPVITFNDVLSQAGLPPIIDYNAVDEWIQQEFDLKLKLYRDRTVDDVIQCIEAGYPVMVLQVYSSTIPSGHNRVVIGYNRDQEILIVNDPSALGANYRMSFKYFDLLWSMWDQIGGWPYSHFLWLIMPVDAAGPISVPDWSNIPKESLEP